MSKRIYLKSFKWVGVSTYRNELFGIAILTVILHHYFEIFKTVEAPNRIIYIIARIYNSTVGSVGVDIFILLSGFGLYYSLFSGRKLSLFYKKRFKRVIYPYLLSGCVFWCIFDFFIRHETFRSFIYHYSLLAFWGSGVTYFWYVSFISLLYIVSPFVYWLTGGRRRFIIGVIGSICIVLVCYFAVPRVFANIEMAIQRLPWFLIGMRCGQLAKNQELYGDYSIPLWLVIILLCAVPVRIIVGIIDFGFDRIFYGYYGLFLIIAYVMLRSVTPGQWDKFFSLFAVVGSYSLELYIVHTAVKNIMLQSGVIIQNPLVYLLHLLIVIPLVACLVKLERLDIRRLSKAIRGAT